jgi:hypothetical protein
VLSEEMKEAAREVSDDSDDSSDDSDDSDFDFFAEDSDFDVFAESDAALDLMRRAFNEFSCSENLVELVLNAKEAKLTRC